MKKKKQIIKFKISEIQFTKQIIVPTRIQQKVRSPLDKN